MSGETLPTTGKPSDDETSHDQIVPMPRQSSVTIIYQAKQKLHVVDFPEHVEIIAQKESLNLFFFILFGGPPWTEWDSRDSVTYNLDFWVNICCLSSLLHVAVWCTWIYWTCILKKTQKPSEHVVLTFFMVRPKKAVMPPNFVPLHFLFFIVTYGFTCYLILFMNIMCPTRYIMHVYVGVGE